MFDILKRFSVGGEGVKPVKVDFVSTSTTREMLDNGELDLLLDVRTNKEFNLGRIEGACNVPLSDLDEHIEKLRRFSRKRVVIHCRTEVRSTCAYEALAKAGFTDIKVMAGGFETWVQENLPRTSRS